MSARTVPALPEFTFPDSGIAVRIRKLSPTTIQQIGVAIRKEKAPPDPPLQDVDYGDGKIAKEPNPVHPDHIEAQKVYEEWFTLEIGTRLLKLIKQRAVVCDVDAKAVQQLKEDMAGIGVVLEGDDRDIYIEHICCVSDRDMEALSAVVLSRSQPTAEAVQAHVDSFRD